MQVAARLSCPVDSAGAAGRALFFALALILSASVSVAQEPKPMPGPLPTAHAALGAAGLCQKCHVSAAKVEARRCLACHEPISRRMTGRKGVHREVTGGCEACHAEHLGADADIRPLDPASFEH